MMRLLLPFLFVFLSVGFFLFSQEQEDGPTELSGGGLTVFNRSRNAFEMVAPGASAQEKLFFASGRRLFRTPWVTAPSSTRNLDGKGPLFNAASCSSCHLRDGRGKPSLDQGLLFRLSLRDEEGEVIPHPIYGGQLQHRALQEAFDVNANKLRLSEEGSVQIRYEKKVFKYPDGRIVQLRRPVYRFKSLQYGGLEQEGYEFMYSPRVAPANFGLGLLEAIPPWRLRELSDPNDENGDGISGRINYVWDAQKQVRAIGRFGWKAGQPSLFTQTASAARNDMGLTNRIHPTELCTESQKACLQTVSGSGDSHGFELSDKQLSRLTLYLHLLAVPARRHLNSPEELRGEEHFHEIGCANCHTAKHQTDENFEGPVVLSDQEIYPYTDLLLHDMGEELADNRPEAEAGGREWRTPPLWGIGLTEKVNEHLYLLHDGRARGFEEAVLWHGGEAAQSRELFSKLSAEERSELIRFLGSL